MTTAAAACAAVLVATGDSRRTAAVGCSLLVALLAPLLAIPIGLAAGGVVLARKLRARAERARMVDEEAAALAELTVIGLTGGLGIQTSLEIAARSVGGTVQAEVAALLRQARVGGLALTMGGAGGIGRDLYRAIGRAVATGSSLGETVTRIAHEANAEVVAARMQGVRRLPVMMLFPLTLLILPGFLLLTIAPALLAAFSRLEI